MKKTFTYTVLFFYSILSLSQNVVIDKPPAWDDSGYVSIITSEGTDGMGVYAADKFILDTEIVLGELDVFGVNVNMPVDEVLSSINVFIYADIGGVPNGDPSIEGSEIIGLTNITEDLFTYEELIIGQPVVNFLAIQLTAANGGNQITLPPGKYWLCFFPTITGVGPNSTWLWTESDMINLDETVPMVIDADGIFGWTDGWLTNAEAIGTDLTSLSFQLRDEEALHIVDKELQNVSLYPNPATNSISISDIEKQIIHSIKVYSTLGEVLITQQDTTQIDVSRLSKGVYYITLETVSGATKTMKFIKS
ncbi:hypothetical protein GCM10011344_21730 [Dokdonia pacifica]|uniref:Por secretion system C-terminal sorting domain-containing protein n=1 Tax=Dokdonia pacifica TaxID=1627892 RepID=A0A238WEL6_9FLAO|nr:T9SS type A sorting domain-containing protein [Dokdonia pacifica]GGG20694.1 hypothetical protein GCM10011344_21730 [Dokdonia pacifica]SNR45005.1 Por secretion system C-terminal sorting domain-containing protein [Dokdonia pacifica]